MSDTPIDTGTSRAAIFAELKRNLASGNEESRRRAVKARLERHEANLVPARGQVDAEARVALFRAQAEAVQASVVEVASGTDVPDAVQRYLRETNLPQRIRHGADQKLSALPWAKVPTLEVAHGRAEPSDEASVSHAFAGVAETGTLILLSGADNPTSLNFLPENHIVVIEKGDVAGTYEEVWARLRERFGEGQMPRALNMVSGPSRTADVEQTIQLGAHGPRRLHIVIVDQL